MYIALNNYNTISYSNKIASTFKTSGLFDDAVFALESQYPEAVSRLCLHALVTFRTQ